MPTGCAFGEVGCARDGRVGDTPAGVTGVAARRAYRRRVHQSAGLLVVMMAGLWLAYLVPHKLRHRQQLLESRADDRYSEALRVVTVTARPSKAVALRGGRVLRTVGSRAHAGTTGLLTPASGHPVLVAGNRTGGDTVDRPHATPERVTAAAARRAAQVRAARAAATAKRAAAARRRAVLAAFLLVATAAGWVAVGLVPTVLPAVGIVPSVLLGSVLVAGRAAVVAGRRNDERMAEQIAASDELAANPRSGATRAVTAPTARVSAPVAAASAASVPAPKASAPASTASAAAASARAAAASAPAAPAGAPTPKVTGRAVHPSEDETQVFDAIVADRGESGATPRHATGEVPRVVADDERAAASSDTPPDAESWEPVPVPRPTYAMKPAAPHREPVSLGEVEASTAVRPAGAEGPASAEADDLRTPEAPRESSGSIDLNAVLAKRRASGE